MAGSMRDDVDRVREVEDHVGTFFGGQVQVEVVREDDTTARRSSSGPIGRSGSIQPRWGKFVQ